MVSDVAWVFPGQGSQRVGMGKALAEQSAAARAVFETVDDALGFPLSQLIFEGPEEALVSTRNQQPAILVASIAYFTALREAGLLPDPCCVAGHSLGEYTALVAAGALDLADAARLVRRRGELMEEHGRGGMVAVLGLDVAALEAVAAETGVEVANFNAPCQTTLSGPAEALEAAAALARTRGARRVVPLPVNGAFHSSLMQPVTEALRPMIEAVPLREPIAPLIADVDARPLRDPGEIRAELLEQITASVRWVDVVQAAHAAGARRFVEIGPGKVLSGLIARIVPGVETVPAETLLG
ncbi:MAG: ACP S-malonyltransferase [Sphaerobacter sp.]|nr:ACP S-malonyltransferase [Sphaerobacter sp.]